MGNYSAAAPRPRTLLPLDASLYALQATIPRLTRSALHRLLQRHGISRLPDVGGDKPGKQAFKVYPIGFFHIDIAEVRTEEGKWQPFVAVDLTSKFTFAQPHAQPTDPRTAPCWRRCSPPGPYHLHTILTDSGIPFAVPPRNRDGPPPVGASTGSAAPMRLSTG